MKSEPIQFRLDEEYFNQMRPSLEGQHPNQLAKRTVERYYNLLRWSLHEVESNFTLGEIGLITDVLNGLMFHSWEITPAQNLRMNVADAIDVDGVDKKWEVDAASLRQKLLSLTNAQAAAVIEAINQWWNDPERKVTREGFAKYGLQSAE